MIDANRDKPWMCWRCGYMMDATTVAKGANTAPAEGDTSVCINCGALFCRTVDRWRPMTPAEYAGLDAATQDQLRQVLEVRVRVIRNDLTKGRGGRA